MSSLVLLLAAYTSCASCGSTHRTDPTPLPLPYNVKPHTLLSRAPEEAQPSMVKKPDPPPRLDTQPITEDNLDLKPLEDHLTVLHKAFLDLALERARLLQERDNLMALVVYAGKQLGKDEVWQEAMAKIAAVGK